MKSLVAIFEDEYFVIEGDSIENALEKHAIRNPTNIDCYGDGAKYYVTPTLNRKST